MTRMRSWQFGPLRMRSATPMATGWKPEHGSARYQAEGRSYRGMFREELLEWTGAAAGVGAGECPGWLIVTIEQKAKRSSDRRT
jgi:hypothetical protein